MQQVWGEIRLLVGHGLLDLNGMSTWRSREEVSLGEARPYQIILTVKLWVLIHVPSQRRLSGSKKWDGGHCRLLWPQYDSP